MGCGSRAPKRELVRFVAVDGELVAGVHAPGRGAYTCCSRSCFERAAASKAFARTLRQPVRRSPAPDAIYTGDVHG